MSTFHLVVGRDPKGLFRSLPVTSQSLTILPIARLNCDRFPTANCENSVIYNSTRSRSATTVNTVPDEITSNLSRFENSTQKIKSYAIETLAIGGVSDFGIARSWIVSSDASTAIIGLFGLGLESAKIDGSGESVASLIKVFSQSHNGYSGSYSYTAGSVRSELLASSSQISLLFGIRKCYWELDFRRVRLIEILRARVTRYNNK